MIAIGLLGLHVLKPVELVLKKEVEQRIAMETARKKSCVVKVYAQVSSTIIYVLGT